MKERVAIIGAGLIGRSWAVVFARAGHQVSLFDIAPDGLAQARHWIDAALGDLDAAGQQHSDATSASARIVFSSDLSEAVANASYIQECVPERIETKRASVMAIEELAAAGTIIASSASVLTGSEIFAGARHPERCIVAHPTNPPHLVPLVEVVPTGATSFAVTDRVVDLMEACGQAPVRVNREVPGYVLNRLQCAVIGEAMALVGDGVIDPEGADRVIREGLGMRWAFFGQFEIMQLNAQGGFQMYVEHYREMWESLAKDLNVARAWSPEAIEAVSASLAARMPVAELEGHAVRRDHLLLTLRRMKSAA